MLIPNYEKGGVIKGDSFSQDFLRNFKIKLKQRIRKRKLKKILEDNYARNS